MSDKIELSKLKKTKKVQKADDSGKVYSIQVIGTIPAELNVVILREKK